MAEAKKTTKSTKAKKTEAKSEEPKAAKTDLKAKQAEAKAKAGLDLSKVDQKQVDKMKQDYAQLKMDLMTGKEKDITKLKELRRNIARALTHIRFKQIVNE